MAMSAAGVRGAQQNGNGNQGAGAVPFMAATYEYSEPMFTDQVQPGTNQQTFLHNITPGGFLRGVTFDVQTQTAGSALVAQADTPWTLFNSISVETIDGTPILYPMSGYAYYLLTRYTRPWDGDPANDPAYVSSATTVAFRLRVFLESRLSLGVWPNTDARAQYRITYTVNPTTSIWTSATTAPVLNINGYLETYAQPDKANSRGQPNVQVPDGLAFQRFCSHEIDATVAGDSTYKSNRVGNLIRNQILVFRNSSGVRTDLTTDPIRWRKDNTQLLVEYRSRRDYEMFRFFDLQSGSLASTAGSYAAHPTGVYVYPRWHNVGDRDGQPWLDTSSATYLQYEVNGASAGGTLEIITEDIAPTRAQLPPHLVGL